MKRTWSLIVSLSLAVAVGMALTCNSANAQISTTSVQANGFVSYKMPSGEIVKRNAVLEVPAHGQGDIILKSGGRELRSRDFHVGHSGAQTFFIVKFDSCPQFDGRSIVLHGTYLRGSNEALYYGDFYTRDGNSGDSSSGDWENLLSGERLSGGHPYGWTYRGGFYFRAPINN
jgi:hypothetical protein